MTYTQDQLKKQVFLLVTKSLTEGLTEEEKAEYNRLKKILGEEAISDGFGSVWSAYCPKCKEKSMSVVRPGKVQCDNCG